MRNKHDDVKKALDDINSNVDCLIGDIMFLVDTDDKDRAAFDEEMQHYLEISHKIRDLTKLVEIIVNIMEEEKRLAEGKLDLIRDLLKTVQ